MGELATPVAPKAPAAPDGDAAVDAVAPPVMPKTVASFQSHFASATLSLLPTATQIQDQQWACTYYDAADTSKTVEWPLQFKSSGINETLFRGADSAKSFTGYRQFWKGTQSWSSDNTLEGQGGKVIYIRAERSEEDTKNPASLLIEHTAHKDSLGDGATVYVFPSTSEPTDSVVLGYSTCKKK